MQRKIMMRAAAALGMCAVLIVGAGACGKAAEKVGEKAMEKSLEDVTGAGADVDASKDGVSVKTKDGEFSSTTTKKLPEGWPAEILPVADGLEIENVTSIKTGNGTVSTVSTKGSGDAADVTQSYVDAFEANGVEVSLQSTSTEGGLVSGTKGDITYQAMISTGAGGPLNVILSVTTTNEPTE